MNKVMLIGRLTKEPDIRYSQDGTKATALFGLAVQRDYKNKNGQYDADFLSLVAYGKSAEFAEKYLSKGMKVAVEGKIVTGSYEKNGQRVYTTNIQVDKFEFVESSNKNAQHNGNAGEGFEGFMDVTTDDEQGLPFAQV